MNSILVISGSRDHNEEKLIIDYLEAFIENYDIVHVGDCKTGVDKFVRDYCIKIKKKHKVFIANWTKYKLAAGPLRNKEMLLSNGVKSDLLIAFPKPGGKGTIDCIRSAKKLKIKRIILHC